MQIDKKKFFEKRAVAIVIFAVVIGAMLIPSRNLSQQISDETAKAKIYVESKNLDQDIYGSDYTVCTTTPSNCPNAINYFYKRTDVYFDFVFLKTEPVDTSGLEKRMAEADAFLRDFKSKYYNLTIDYSYIDSSGATGDIAMDTSCILGWTYNDTTIYHKIRNDLKDYGWTNPNTTQPFRNIIDETWCISLLGENGENSATTNHLLELKKQEFYTYISGPDYLDRKIVGGLHYLLMFDRLQHYGYDVSQYSDFISFIENYVVNQTQTGHLLYPLEVYHNTLYTLAKIHYQDKTFLSNLAEKIIVMQNSDGSWYVPNPTNDTRYSLLLALRCVIALNLFKVNYL